MQDSETFCSRFQPVVSCTFQISHSTPHSSLNTQYQSIVTAQLVSIGLPAYLCSSSNLVCFADFSNRPLHFLFLFKEAEHGCCCVPVSRPNTSDMQCCPKHSGWVQNQAFCGMDRYTITRTTKHTYTELDSSWSLYPHCCVRRPGG